jgi:hypothetical protein
MGLIWTSHGQYHRVGYDSEADLEATILNVQSELFGRNRIYHLPRYQEKDRS